MTSTVPPFCLRRLGVLMTPDTANPHEAEGVLNPGVARGPDGELYIFPRLVAKGNYSRIGVGRVRFNDDGDPVHVERLGVALEPAELYEKNPVTGGGCEDPRVTFVEPFGAYVMTYTAFSPDGPKIALAMSHDLLHWERLGLVRFGDTTPFNFNDVDNKDALVFPELIPDAHGTPSIGVIHRPLMPGTHAHQIMQDIVRHAQPAEAPDTDLAVLEECEQRRPRIAHESLWISYCNRPGTAADLCALTEHSRLMSPRAWWERLKVGGGAPPLRTRHGWLVLYHGVRARMQNGRRSLCYSAGVVVLDAEQPHRIRYRSAEPILRPGEEETMGITPNVVFPTGIDLRADIGQPDRIDVYFGMADNRIGVASMLVPAELPLEASEKQRDLTPAA